MKFFKRPHELYVAAFFLVAFCIYVIPLFMSFGIGVSMATIYLGLLAQGGLLALVWVMIYKAKRWGYVDLQPAWFKNYAVIFIGLIFVMLMWGLIQRNARPNVMRDLWVMLFYFSLLRLFFFPHIWDSFYRLGIFAFWFSVPFILIGLTRTGTTAFSSGIGPGLALSSDNRSVLTSGYEMRPFLYMWPILFSVSYLSVQGSKLLKWLGMLTPLFMLFLLVAVFAFRAQAIIIALLVVLAVVLGAYRNGLASVPRLFLIGLLFLGTVAYLVYSGMADFVLDRAQEASSLDYRVLEVQTLSAYLKGPIDHAIGFGLGGGFPFVFASGSGAHLIESFIFRTEIHVGHLWLFMKGGGLLFFLFYFPVLKSFRLNRRIKYDSAYAAAIVVVFSFLVNLLGNPFPTFDAFMSLLPYSMAISRLSYDPRTMVHQSINLRR